jgi:hypothetical protein
VNRPLGRDYKRSRGGSGLDFARWREFAIGLGIGLAVAVALFVYQRNALDRASIGADVPHPDSPRLARKGKGGAAGDPADAGEDGGHQYDFYEMLPKFEVVVPEKEREVRGDVPSAPIERPGVYVLQAGSYRKLEDAQRIRAQLSLQGVDANVQRVAVDSDVWHRVRVGPVSDLAELNRLRGKLRTADLDALVIRVGD